VKTPIMMKNHRKKMIWWLYYDIK